MPVSELTDEERAAFAQDGYFMRTGVLDAERCLALRERAAEIVSAFDARENVNVFSTQDHRHTSTRWFLDSGDSVRCFFEELAVSPEGEILVPKERAINKIGHALHSLDPVFRALSEELGLERLAAGLGQREPRVIQSMYIFKQPYIGGEVRIHQDSSYLFTRPESCIGFWFALEDATREVACLWVEPGGHRGPLRERFVRHDDDSTALVPLDDTPFDSGALVPIEVPMGTMLGFHGCLPHYSALNRSPRSRQAYTIHTVDAACEYPTDNWLRVATEYGSP